MGGLGNGHFDRSSDPAGLQARPTAAGGRSRALPIESLRARQRLGIEPVRRLFQEVVRPLARPDTPGAFYHGLRLMGIDGTTLNVPDTAANDGVFGRPSGGHRGEGAFPQVRKLSLVELGTHVEVAFQVKPCGWSEQAMLPALLHHVTPDMLLVWDRNFFSYDLWKTLISREIKLLARVKADLVLQPIRCFSDGSYLAKIYRNAKAREDDCGGIVVRVIDYTLDDPQRTGHGEKHVLLTNLLDADIYPAKELICGYHERWEHELVYDEQKTHQDPRRPTKPANLRSETPAGVIQELYALSLGHFVICSPMFAAAARGTRHGPALFHRLSPHPAMPAAGMRCPHAARFSGGVNGCFGNWARSASSRVATASIPA